MRFKYVVFVLIALYMGPAMAADFSTAQGALLALDEANRTHNIEAAVAAKNFTYEAHAMLASLSATPHADASLVQKAAHVLELAYRKEIQNDGFPDLKGIQLKIISTKVLAPDLVAMTERVTYPDGYASQEVLHAALSGTRWGIVNLPGK